MLTHLKQRSGSDWDSDELRAFDLQWHDLRPSSSIITKLDNAGRVDRLYTSDQLRQALRHAPHVSRAYFRETLLRHFTDSVHSVGWSGAVVATPEGPRRINFMDPATPTFDQITEFFATPQTPLSASTYFEQDSQGVK